VTLDEAADTPAREVMRKYRVTKGKRDLYAEYEAANKERFDEAYRLMVDENASNYEVSRQCGFGTGTVQRIRRRRVEKVDHIY